MPCYSPLSAYRVEGGGISFRETSSSLGHLTLPCGRCIGCRLARVQQWGIRCMHEAQMHHRNCFVTLTYDDKHLPFHGQLYYRDFQLFMKRLRRKLGKVRFFACGEYGEKLSRPHYHACLFGIDFPDMILHQVNKSGNLYTSAVLSSLWTDGFASVGQLSLDSARYVAGYCVKKINGPMAEAHYAKPSVHTGELTQLPAEFAHMSLRPGIGKAWFDKYRTDLFPHDYAVVDGKKHLVPKYYFNLAKLDPDFDSDSIEYKRYLDSQAHAEDQTPERLTTRAQVAKARQSTKKRQLETST